MKWAGFIVIHRGLPMLLMECKAELPRGGVLCRAGQATVFGNKGRARRAVERTIKHLRDTRSRRGSRRPTQYHIVPLEVA